MRVKQSLKRQRCENVIVGGVTPELIVVEPDVRPRQDRSEVVVDPAKQSTDRVLVVGKPSNENRPHAIDIYRSSEGEMKTIRNTVSQQYQSLFFSCF